MQTLLYLKKVCFKNHFFFYTKYRHLIFVATIHIRRVKTTLTPVGVALLPTLYKCLHHVPLTILVTRIELRIFDQIVTSVSLGQEKVKC